MSNNYKTTHLAWLLTVLLALVAGRPAQAQSGPFGNEWIVAGQSYYKIKVHKTGLYRLDYQYLTNAGISGVKPTELQMWRRGKELAIYVGGNQSTLDATTYVEFFGQRNDGQLDRSMYMEATDQPHTLYSMFSDTAAYFLTWKAGVAGKRMQESTVNATGAVHTSWLRERNNLLVSSYNAGDVNSYSYVPWAEKGEAFLSGAITQSSPKGRFATDSILVNRSLTDSVDVTVLLVGNSANPHAIDIDLISPVFDKTNTDPLLRLIRQVELQSTEIKRVTFKLAVNELSSDNRFGLRIKIRNPEKYATDRIRIGYINVKYRQATEWTGTPVFFENDSTVTGSAYYSLPAGPSTVTGFDITNPDQVQRITQSTATAGRMDFIFPAATGRQRQLLLANTATALIPSAATLVKFSDISVAKSNFIIISHPELEKNTGEFQNPVRSYADYRASTAGGSYDTLVLMVPKLYDQFHYGESSPMAIRHFVQWLQKQNNVPNKYILILGKGVQLDERANVPNGPSNVLYRQFEARMSTRNLVPVTTRSPSDNFYTANWENRSYIPEIPIGRIPAQNSGEVAAYLKKIIDHENLKNEPWRKNLLHLAGGLTESEQVQFKGYVNEYKKLAEAPLLGGNVVRTISRTTVGTTPVFVNIAPELNNGLSVITYFGHGSPTNYNLNLGNPNDPINNYNNKGRYPVFIINGCSGGNSFLPATISVGENWLLASEKGAIGFLADTDYGFENQLHYYCTNMYKGLFNDPAWYGKPVAVIYQEVARRVLARYSKDIHAISLVINTEWQGDPTLRLYSPDKPDYATNDTRLNLLPAQGQTKIEATSTEFRLQVGVSNLGKWTNDKVMVKVTREYPGNRAAEVTTYTLARVAQDTVFTVTLSNSGTVFGRNRFTVELDADQKIEELNEGNNKAVLEYNFLQGGLTLLSPTEFAIVPSSAVHLIAQNNDPLTAVRGYDFELDTIPGFNSTAIQRKVVTASTLPDWKPSLPMRDGQDSIVYYWRVRFQTPASDENAEWFTGSFRVIPNSPTGWSQSHYGQFKRDELSGIQATAPATKWNFTSTNHVLTLRTKGSSGVASYNFLYGIQVDDNGVSSTTCGVNRANILVTIYNPKTLSFIGEVAGGPYTLCGAGPSQYYHFAPGSSANINQVAQQAQLLKLLNNVPAGYYVAVVSLNSVNFSKFTPELKAAFNRLGSKLIDELKDGDGFVLVGQQGLTAGQAAEAGPDPASATPRTDQLLVLTKELQTNGSNGQVTSTLIGPAQQWGNLFYTLSTPGTASAKVRVLGIDAQGRSTVLRGEVTGGKADLSTVSAAQYPYLQLQLDAQDEDNRQAPQLRQWLVTYSGLPEGVVRRDLAAAGSYDKLDDQALTGVVQLPVVFQNASLVDFAEKVKAVATIRNGTTEQTVELESESALKADETVTYLFKLDVSQLTGATTVRVVVNPQLQPELFYFNNELNVAFDIPDKNLPPSLDVAFDGQHILNGDIVSPTPVITAVLHDDDTRRAMEAGNFEVLLTRPGGGFAEVIDMSSSAISFKTDVAKGTAQIDYRPEKLADGVYKLQVQGKDAIGSRAATERYEVTFEVVNASTITNIYPFPNPVTSKTRFVFTMTGAEMPRDMKIQIMTLTGKVVREIAMAELGPLHIGNNMTEYAWDGTDEFGDKLANGTYLYRVIMDKTGQFEHRRTDGDKAFKKDWGKLVLLR